jgi:hypothetical protein
MKKCVSKAGKKFSAKFRLDKEHKVEFVFDKKRSTAGKKPAAALKKT